MSTKKVPLPKPVAAGAQEPGPAKASTQTMPIGALPDLETALHRLAEEFGRLVARAERNPRRGYSLAEILLGVAITAASLVAVWLLCSR